MSLDRAKGIKYWVDINKMIILPCKWWSIKEWVLFYKLRKDSDVVGFRKS